MPLQGGYVYWQLAGRPLAVAPKVEEVKGKNQVDSRRWQVVYVCEDEGEPLTSATLTLEGAKRVAERLEGESLVELQAAMKDVVKTTRPADLADWVENTERRLERSAAGRMGRYADGRYRRADGRTSYARGG